MLLLSLVLLGVNNKEDMIRRLLEKTTVVNQNILILIYVLYTLLVPTSDNVF